MPSYYEKHKDHLMKKVKEVSPESFKAFLKFEREIFRPGALTKKEKELIAVAIAHVIKCPYCIDVHTKKAKFSGASMKELAEAVFVVSAMEAGAAAQYSSYFNREKSSHQEHHSKPFEAYADFVRAVMEEGSLTEEFKTLLALTVSYVIQCPQLINFHTKRSKDLGVSEERIEEAIFVAAALKAGGAYAHLIHLYESYFE